MSENEITDEITNEEQYKMNIQDEFRLSLAFIALPLFFGVYSLIVSTESFEVGGVISRIVGEAFIIMTAINVFNLFMQYILWNKSKKDGLYMTFHILFFITSSITALPFLMMIFGIIDDLFSNGIDFLSLETLIGYAVIALAVILYVVLMIVRVYNLSFRSKVDISKLK